MKQAKGLWFVLILILILIVSFGFSGCSASDQPSGEGESLPGILAQFETTTLTGETVDQAVLEEYDLTMVNVWATFCGPCINEMPDIAKIADESREQGVQVLGLVSDVMARDGSLDPVQVALAE
ncbi:MAG: TlpA family protein disulfide reductase, partial [Firmicutes bacterium]|nr:TlpA family protein disulfide reductase [Bacillota bacterium]